jgi:outer membrane protein insertion porin family
MVKSRMVKTPMSNSNWRTIRHGLALACALLLMAGCAGVPNSTDSRSRYAQSTASTQRPASTQTTAGGPPPLTMAPVDPPSTSPGTVVPASYAASESPTTTTAKPPAPIGAPPNADTPPTSSPAATKVSIRGQDGYEGNETLPGSNNLMRYPMPASGDTTTQQVQASGQNGTRVAAQPAAPPAASGAAAASVVDNNEWLSSPYLNGNPQGDLFPVDQLPGTAVPIDVMVEEARTGRFMFGAGVNSDAGVTGQITIDERNFDLFGFPRSFSDIWSGRAWRGAGQGFRIEAMPGNQVQRYLVSFTEPYLFSTNVGLNVSAYLFDRGYFDWDENRVGGRLGLSYRLAPDLSVTGSLRMEDVDISDPRVLGVAELDEVIGSNDLYTGRITLRHDTRDMPFMPTEGHLIEMSFEQAFGEFDYPRGEVDYNRYFLIRERPDGSGRHVLSASIGAGFSGSDTPLFENYFAGGFSTLRGFSFRGASPVVNTVTVGGQFRLLGSFEYMMPLTADDMIRAVGFVDYGTVEQEIALEGDNFRVAPGFGFRIAVPALGPAPLAFDFAFPVAKAPTDDEQVFSFFFGFQR